MEKSAKNADLEKMVASGPIETAYCLALINAKGPLFNHSALGAEKLSPVVERVYRLLEIPVA
jgi:hypothetical protein